MHSLLMEGWTHWRLSDEVRDDLIEFFFILCETRMVFYFRSVPALLVPVTIQIATVLGAEPRRITSTRALGMSHSDFAESCRNWEMSDEEIEALDLPLLSMRLIIPHREMIRDKDHAHAGRTRFLHHLDMQQHTPALSEILSLLPLAITRILNSSGVHYPSSTISWSSTAVSLTRLVVIKELEFRPKRPFSLIVSVKLGSHSYHGSLYVVR